MACLFEHNWGWPRRRGNRDMQVCLDCGVERESRVRFDGPRYRRTQDPMPLASLEDSRREPVAAPVVVPLRSVA